MSVLDIYSKAMEIVKAWQTLRPNKALFRMSLEDFQKLIAPSGDARAELAALDTQTRDAVTRRDQADKVTRRAVIRIVNAVKGDPDEGEDGELLAAMGYLPHTVRSSLVSTARRNASASRKAAEEKEGEE